MNAAKKTGRMLFDNNFFEELHIQRSELEIFYRLHRLELDPVVRPSARLWLKEKTSGK